MGKKSSITLEMAQIILDNYQTKTHKEIATMLGNVVSYRSIEYWLHKHNITKKVKIFSDEQIEYIKEHYKDMTYSQIAKKLGFTDEQIRTKVSHLGLRKTREFNKMYFHVIDNPIKAYYIGLIYADGCLIYNNRIESRTYELSIKLQSEDKYILEIFNQELGGVHKITHYNPVLKTINGVKTTSHDADAIRVYSKQIVSDLIDLGVLPNKTQKNNYPTIPDKYFMDFLRGYIDGDGCFSNNKSCYILHITCANRQPLEWIKEKLKKDYEIKTQIYKLQERKYRLMCTNKSSMSKLVNLLYYSPDVICLKRKYNKIKSYINGFAA